jgi:hypothetical protein
METLKLTNGIHNTETIVSAETWETKLGKKMATVSQSELKKAARVLCGMNDCLCGGWRGKAVDENDIEYTVTTK